MPAPNPFLLAHALVQIRAHHLLHEVLEARRVLPAEPLARLRGIPDQEINLGRPEVARIDLDQHGACPGIAPDLVEAGPAPLDRAARLTKRDLDQLAHRVLLA